MKSNPIITDEMLAAYMAGNATAHETALILRAVETNPTIRETLQIMAELESEEAVDVLPMMAMAAKNEVDNLCAIRCIGYALRHFGIDVTDEQIHADALRSDSLTSQGMPFGMLGEFIRPHGLDAQYQSDCSIDQLRKYLSQENVVIALVDGGELTGDAIQEWQEDMTIGSRPDHVVVVERVTKDSVIIRDSYTPEQLDTYSLTIFMDAWGDSGRSGIVVSRKEKISKKYFPLFAAVCASILALLFHSVGATFILFKLFYSLPFFPSKDADHISDIYNYLAYDDSPQSSDSSIIVFDITDCERKDFIQILSVLNRMHPKVIGLDVRFDEKRNDSIDAKLLEVLKETDNLVLPVAITDAGDKSYGCFYDSLPNKEYGVAAWNDKEIITRDFNLYTEDSIPFFSYAIAYLYDSTICNAPNHMLINYSTLHMRPQQARATKDLLDSCHFQFFEKRVNGKIVLLGETSDKSLDKLVTPCSGNASSMHGVLFLAHIVNMLLQRKTIIELPMWIRFILVFFFSALYCYKLPIRNNKFNRKLDSIASSRIRYFLNFLLKYMAGFVLVSILFLIIGYPLFRYLNYYWDFSMYIAAFLMCNLIYDISNVKR